MHDETKTTDDAQANVTDTASQTAHDPDGAPEAGAEPGEGEEARPMTDAPQGVEQDDEEALYTRTRDGAVFQAADLVQRHEAGRWIVRKAAGGELVDERPDRADGVRVVRS